MNAHQEIESRLKLVRNRIRQAQIKRAAWIVATVILSGVLITMAADFFFAPLPTAARWVLFAAWVCALILTAKSVLAPLVRSISLIQIARWIEHRHPEMQERLSTVLELSRSDSGVSRELLDALGRAANEDIIKVDPQGEIRSAQTKLRWGKPAAVLGVILLISLVVWPKEASRLLVRAIVPFSAIGNAGAVKFNIDPGNFDAFEGDRVEIKIGYEGDANSLDFRIQIDGRKEITQPLIRGENGFNYVLDPARENFKYRVQSGREQSDVYTATVWPLPRIIEPQVTLEYPAYTGLLKSEQPLGESIEAVEGTTIHLTGPLNTPIERGWIEIAGKRIADAKIETSATGARVNFSWQLGPDFAGEAVVKFKHRLGREVAAHRFAVKSLPDQNPQLRIVSPTQKQLKVRPDEVLDVRYEVTEDFSLARTSIEVEAQDRKAMIDQLLPFAVKGTRPSLYQGSATIVVGELRTQFPGVNEMKVRVRAEDGRPADLGGPGVGTSEWITIRIDQGAESLARQELRAEHDGARETIEKALNEARQAKDQMEGIRNELQKESMNENAVKRLEQWTEKLASAQEKIAELAKEMEQGVHAAKADEVQKAAENLQKAREDLENAPLQDQKDTREAKLNESRQNAEQAIKQLEEVRNAMDRDREKVQDLAKMQELAQQQQELARQAQENLENSAASAKDEPQRQNQQKQIEEQLRQQLRERPDAKAEALKAQAEAAKAMAEDAREISAAQKNLQEQTKQPDPEKKAELLQQALAKEQAKIAEATKEKLAQAQQALSETADILPEATHAADAALEQIQKGETKAAAESAKDAAEAMKLASGQKRSDKNSQPVSAATDPAQAEAEAERSAVAEAASNPADKAAKAAQAEALSELAERQQSVAEAMEALAKGDVGEALKGLQKAQAETATEFAEAIKETPLAENSGQMNEASNTAKQGSQRAQTAEKSGQANQQEQAAQQHEQASQDFQKSAEALDRAAEEFNNLAQQTAAQQPNPNKAEMPAAELAQAFQLAAEAANSEGDEAAQAAAKAAEALSKAAQEARAKMQGKPSGKPAMANSSQPGDKPPAEDKLQPRSASPGVPPELAKLGISASDWEKIQATLKSDVGAGGADSIPEEYRRLVKGYFESMSKKKD